MVDFTDLDLEEFFGLGDDTSIFMMLVWILPVVIFVFYGQRIQLQITSGEIKKGIKKLDSFRGEARTELIGYLERNHGTKDDPSRRVDQFLEYFAIPPVDLDPAGLVPKIRHTVRSREDYTRRNIGSLIPGISGGDLNRVQTLLEIASSLQMIYKVINHMFLTAKKQNNYPLILPLQMMLPFIMEEAAALKDAVSAFKENQPVGDGIGPMVVGKMMLNTIKEEAAFQTVLGRTEYEGRNLILLKAEGPSPTVGRPADAVEAVAGNTRLDAIIMVDAALKFEGEDSASVAQGFGAAIGGVGTERFLIEEVATRNGIPVFAIVVKQSVREAITLMTKEIAEKAGEAGDRVYDLIGTNTSPGDTVLVIGVGNTAGVGQ